MLKGHNIMFDSDGFQAHIACIWEATSRKVGNVHPNADFDDMRHIDLVISAAALANLLGYRRTAGRPLGEEINFVVGNLKDVVPTNTNLGIVLLLMPLLRVPGYCALENPPSAPWYDFKKGIETVLKRLSVEDAVETYKAIRAVNPGGLGTVRKQDVNGEPTVTLLKAMQMAADRDMVARQYANGFADVFDFGVPSFLAAFERFGSVEAAVIDCQLRWLAEYPDSLIARKNGPHVAEDVRKWAAGVLKSGGIETPEGRAAGVELDRYLRSDGNKLNPGTTADLITACLFVALRENKIAPSAPFRWNVEDWL